MRAANEHSWDVSPREAIALQRELAGRVVRRGSPRVGDVRRIAGADVAFDRSGGRAVAVVTVVDATSLEVVEEAVVEAPICFPYVPGLLSFRETPPLLRAFERLRSGVDLLMVDGHGYAHPRRFGYACHLGLLLDVPTIGVAKSRLVGAHGDVARERGSRADLIDHGEVVGSLLRTRERVRPVYVSVGHRLGLAAAERWVLRCTRGYRSPEPVRVADALSRRAKRHMLDATLDIVIEQRAGEHGRWEWKRDDDEVRFERDLEPMPTHYGCSIDILNDADGELLDVIVADPRERARGERMRVRVVDVLERTDGDDKLLAVPIEDDATSAAVRRRLTAARKASWAWYVAYRRPVVRWGGEDAAVALIRRCRALA
jgi:deoxyribonuclease V